jgi:hypothetical protein
VLDGEEQKVPKYTHNCHCISKRETSKGECVICRKLRTSVIQNAVLWWNELEVEQMSQWPNQIVGLQAGGVVMLEFLLDFLPVLTYRPKQK